MEKLNVLTWEKNLYLEADPIANDCIEFAFKIDGIPVDVFFQEDFYESLDFNDILHASYFENSENHNGEKNPVLIWDGCDHIEAQVSINTNTVTWKVFKKEEDYIRSDEESILLGEVHFDRVQYETTITELLEQARRMKLTTMNHTEIVKTIKNKLSEIEKRENIKIIYACESGSRAWGFASPDSDYDVRFIYIRPVEFYLKLENTRDTLECELNEVYDITGWDLKKFLWLLNKSNPSIFEWAQSPIVYKKTKEWNDISKIINGHFSKQKALYHYNSITKNNLSRYFDGKKEVKYKPYLYNLRQCLACEWIMDKQTPPSIEFSVLADAYLPEQLKDSVSKLVEMKKSMSEKDKGLHITEIDNYIQSVVSKVDNFLETPEEKQKSDWNELNGLFLKLTQEKRDDKRFWTRWLPIMVGSIVIADALIYFLKSII